MADSSSSWQAEPAPLVIVEGFLCATSSFIWGDFEVELANGEAESRRLRGMKAESAQSPSRRVLWAPIGPVSSCHDRACELFYALRGGTVDYGSEHAAAHGHSRWGRQYPSGNGMLPFWSAEHPIHLVGHSLGGTTIVKLRQLLNSGFFDATLGLTTSKGQASAAGALVRSITTISSPLRGTPLVYLLGEQPTPSPQVRFLSAGDLLAKTIHMAVWIRAHSATARRCLPDAQADAWSFAGSRASGHDDVEAGFSSVEQPAIKPWTWREGWGLPDLLKQLYHSEWAEGRDCAPWDCTLGERARCEVEEPGWVLDGEAGTPTWFRSYACYMTDRLGSKDDSPKHQPSSSLAWSLSALPFKVTSKLLGRFDYGSAKPSQLFGFGCAAKVVKDILPRPPSPPRTSPHDYEKATDSGYCSRSSIDGKPPAPSVLIEALAGEAESAAKRQESEYEDEAWYANDGVVPLASQYHPGSCSPDLCSHSDGLPMLASHTAHTSLSSAVSEPLTPPLPQPNRWEVHHLRDTTHASLCPLWTGGAYQRQFWRGMGRWLADVDAAATVEAGESDAQPLASPSADESIQAAS